MRNNDKLAMWQRRLQHNKNKWEEQKRKFDHREKLVLGSPYTKGCTVNDPDRKALVVRNLTSELIEAQIDTTVPMPKVTARNKEDERLAHIIEDMIIDEMRRLPMETINDMQERTVPIQGGSFYLFEWDNSESTQNTVGDITVQALHPKKVVPQDGIYTSVEDMDYIIIKLPQTKKYIEHKYGISVKDEGEEEPSARGKDEDMHSADGMVTQYVAYYRNEKGGIGKYSWVRNIELEDLDDYQARRLTRCQKCHAVVPLNSEPLDVPTLDGKHPTENREDITGDNWMDTIDGNIEEKAITEGHLNTCPYCGGPVKEQVEEFEEVYLPRVSNLGVQIPGQQQVDTIDEQGNLSFEMVPTKIPYYKPNCYPVILQRSVSTFGQLLGESDVDKIESQQNASNRLGSKIMDMLLKCGSFMTLPTDAMIDTSNEDAKIIRLESVADKSMIDTIDMLPDYENFNSVYSFYSEQYEEARQNIGITDSYQGRRDNTATSGKAKEFAAQQSAGRLESKRVMKEAAYQQIFEMIFKLKLAYADEPRPIIARDTKGNTIYEKFDRYDFLKQDESGQYYWEDRFIFDVDPSTPLVKDRESLWQEVRMNLQTGAYGDPSNLETLVHFWDIMEQLHYPSAGYTKKHLNDMLEQQKMMMAQQQQQMQMQMETEKQIADDQAEADAVTKILGGQDGKNTEKKNSNFTGRKKETNPGSVSAESPTGL